MFCGIVNGYQNLIKHIANKHAHPTRTYPEGIVCACTACKSGVIKKHPPHTRKDEPPKLCKYPDVPPWKWTCPSCNVRLRRDHHRHTSGENSKHYDDDIRRRRKADRSKRAAPPPHKDPAIAAAGEPTTKPPSDNAQDDLDPNPPRAIPGANASVPSKEEEGGANRPDVPAENLNDDLLDADAEEHT